MRKLTCVIVDDEPLAVQLLEAFVNRTDFLCLLQSFTDPIEAASFISQNKVDLLFLDIQMPDVNGLELARSLGGKRHERVSAIPGLLHAMRSSRAPAAPSSAANPTAAANEPPLYADGAAYSRTNHPASSSHIKGDAALTLVPSASLPVALTSPFLPTVSDMYPLP